MMSSRLRNVLLIALGAAGLAACNEGYGYGGVEVGYGAAYPAYGPENCDPWWGDCYDPYAYGAYGDPWWGWWDDFYYPGFGVYVFDRHGHRHHWNDGQRHHWEARRGAFPNRNWNDPRWQNWSGFHQGGAGNPHWNGGNPHWNGGSPHWGGGPRAGGGGSHPGGGSPHVSGGGHVSSGTPRSGH